MPRYKKCWWLKGCKLRVLKKYHKGAYQDGVMYTWDRWHKLISLVRKLRPGDSVWNIYNKRWATVERVEFEWQLVRRVHVSGSSVPRTFDVTLRRPVGAVIRSFIIFTDDDYLLTDLDHLHDTACPRDERWHNLNTKLGGNAAIKPFFYTHNNDDYYSAEEEMVLFEEALSG